jgi:hypothetical protein
VVRLSPFWEFELALTRHYLGADGPEGSAPLEFVDASRRRIALAMGRGEADADATFEQFLRVFSRSGLVDAFSHGYALSPPGGLKVMGWFNYLVLSCHVASVSPDVSESGLFNERLREVLRLDRGISSLSGLADLWRKARDWCEARNAAGDDVRRIVLPDPYPMTRIGHSIRIVFPSRHDLGRMERLFGDLAAGPPPRSDVLAARVRREIPSHSWSQGFLRAFSDFDARQARRERLLADHPFWLAMTALRRDVDEERRETSFVLEASTDFDGLDTFSITTDDERLSSALGIPRADGDATEPYTIAASVGQIVALLSSGDRALPRELVSSLTEGVVPFGEGDWGVWRAARDPECATVRLLARDDVCRLSPDTSGQRSGWTLLRPVPWEEARRILAKVRGTRLTDTSDLVKVRVTGGIRMEGSYLGRPGFLPVVRAVEGCDAEAVPVGGVEGTLSVDFDGPDIRLHADGAVSGVWRISVGEAGSRRASPAIVFERDALETTVELPDRLAPGWRADEPAMPEASPIAVEPLDLPYVDVEDTGPLYDLLEAIYAGGGRGWPEHRLVPLISARIPDEHAGWDVLRMLAEVGWLTPRVSRDWRARRWFLAPPRLLRFADGRLALDGAAPARTRRKFRDLAIGSGGRVEVRCLHRPWSVSTLVAAGGAFDALPRELGLEIVPAEAYVPPPDVAATFPVSVYTDSRRLVASTWSWAKGRFVSFGGDACDGVRIEHLATHKPNAPDIFRVIRHEEVQGLFDGRSAAIVLAHRLAGRPMFRFDGSSGTLERNTSEGCLPPQLSAYLRLRSLCGPAIIFGADGSRVYRTPCSPSDARRLRTILGPAIDAGEGVEASKPDLLRALAMGRARGPAGRHFAWRDWRGGTC